MGVYTARTLDFGRGQAGNDLATTNGVNGATAIVKGYTADGDGTVSVTTGQHQAGYSINSPYAYYFTVIGWQYLYMAAKLPRNAKVLYANLIHTLSSASTVGSTVPALATEGGLTGAPIEVWAIRRRMTFSGGNFTGFTNTNYFTATPWQEKGIKFGIGSDTDAAYLGRYIFTQADYDYLSPGNQRLDKRASIREELQRALDEGQDMILAIRGGWSKPSTSAAALAVISVDSRFQSGNNQHCYFEVGYRYAREFYAEGADGRYDPTKLLDATSEGLAQQIYAGTPARGSITSPIKTFVRGEITNQQLAVVVHAGTVRVGSIRHVVVGSGRCRTVRAYPVATGQGTISGEWEFAFTSATLYDVYVTPEGGARTLVATGKSTASDETISYTSLTMLMLKSAANGNWSGTFASGDKVFVEIAADLHSTSAPLSSLDSFEIMPHTAGDRSSADTLQSRVASRGRTCQLCGSDTRAIANSTGPVTGVIAVVTDSGTWTHIKVPDPMIFTVGDLATLAEYGAADDDGGAGRVEHVTIEAVYDINDATYPGQVRLAETITSPTDFDDTSIFTSAVWVGKLDPPTEKHLQSAASTSSDILTLTGDIGITTGVVVILDLTATEEDAAFEERTIRNPPTVSLAANQIQLTANPSRAWPAGALVYARDDDASNVPFYVRAAPPIDATKGKKLGYVVADAWALAE